MNKAITNFVDLVLDNRFTPILTYFAKQEKLSQEEIESLKKLIEKGGADDGESG